MTGDPPGSAVWSDAVLTAALFAIDPVGLGGVVARARPGPARDRWMDIVRSLLPAGAPFRRIPLRIDDDRLLGGLDLTASLAAQRPIIQRGLLIESDGGVAVLSMAERIETDVAAKLSAALDHGEVAIEREGLALRIPTRFGVVALDEGLAPDERPPMALLERLAFHIDLEGLGHRDAGDGAPAARSVADARARLDHVVSASQAVIEGLCVAATMLGVSSCRAPLLALRAARAHAAFEGRVEILVEDAAVAARLVLGPRATTAPVEPDAPSPEDGPETRAESSPDHQSQESTQSTTQPEAMSDLVIDAIRAALPDDLLAGIAQDNRMRARAAAARGSGARAVSARRGRPVGSRPGALRPGDRLDVPATLRAAAPWQGLRNAGRTASRLRVRTVDFRIRRFVRKRESTTIFVVDASGSAALQRLAEAKGAVELLLAKAYVSRDRVALIAFRNTAAEVLLPPTRSLTRAKRQLADLAGGGGTPLACGLEAAFALAQSERAHERTPLIVLLTDGRANIQLSGEPGRAAAEVDALAAAHKVGGAGIGAVFIDTSPRPRPGADRFARAMGGVYAPLPYVDASAVAAVVDGAPGRR